jgi:uridine kinase
VRRTDLAELVVRTILRRQPRLGSTRLLCIDGRAGSGKTSLARGVGRAAARLSAGTKVRVLHMDDMYEGWGGLGAVSQSVERDLIAPLRADRPGRYRRYDWHRERYAEWRTVRPVDLLVLEGVGSGSASYGPDITLLVWVDAPRDLRIARGVARDGEAVLPYWSAWMASEDELFARERTRERAHLIVDATGGAHDQPGEVVVLASPEPAAGTSLA